MGYFMEIRVFKSNETCTIAINGRFTFEDHREFRKAYNDCLEIKGVKKVAIDFLRAEYLDSSALGMLLMLRERAKSMNVDVSLVNAKGSVYQVLEIANFHKLFSIT